jgi:hypothetical protein
MQDKDRPQFLRKQMNCQATREWAMQTGNMSVGRVSIKWRQSRARGCRIIQPLIDRVNNPTCIPALGHYSHSPLRAQTVYRLTQYRFELASHPSHHQCGTTTAESLLLLFPPPRLP